jgi:NitT/TauT family transport system substrate-binding protein
MKSGIQVLALLAVVLASAFGASSNSFAQLTTVKLAAPTPGVMENLPLFMARDGGIFEKHGLKVEVFHFSGGDLVRAASTGAVDIAYPGASAVIMAIARGEPLKIISSASDGSFGTVWIVAPNSPLKSVKDLAGKRVGISRPGSVSHVIAQRVLEVEGLVGKAELVPTGGLGESLQAMRTGRVDSAWNSAPTVYELIKKDQARILFRAIEYFKEYQQGAVAASVTYLKSKPEVAKAFLAGLAEGIEALTARRADAIRINAKAMGLSEEVIAAALDDMPKGLLRVGIPKHVNLEAAIEEAVQAGGLTRRPTYEELVDASYLPN